ncbi:hypothetical protein ACFWWM_29575 [Streptomyces sp. NPDC058682]|uniref:hypothetical protein n=1 Tax=Streptomyces sp. NPDC058682 TaxID=3346596 RepID=UPI00365DF19B
MYEEAVSGAVPGAVRWRATAGGGSMVLPDGCTDLLWVDGRLLVAGPDTGPHPAGEVPGGAFAGIRRAPGTAPARSGGRPPWSRGTGTRGTGTCARDSRHWPAPAPPMPVPVRPTC